MLLFIAKGILNGSGEFSSKSPRYWGKEDAGTRISLFSDPCVDYGGNCPSIDISIVVNKANVLPLFKIFPTRFGFPPI